MLFRSRLQPGGRIWVSANAKIASDADGKLTWTVKDAANNDVKLGEPGTNNKSTSGMSFEGKVRYFADMRNVWVTPWARFATGQTDDNSNSLLAAGVDVEYKVDKLPYTLGLAGGQTNVNGVEASQSRVLVGAVLEF